MGPITTFEELFAMLRSRAPLLFLIVFLGTLGAVIFALLQNPIYQARAVIQVQTPTVADRDEAVQSTARRLQQIEQRLTAHDKMLELADKYGLFNGIANNQRVELMRESIMLHSIAAPQEGFGRDGVVSSMIIYAQTGDAQSAADLTSELAQTIMDMGSLTRSSRVADSLAFFRSEEARLSEELSTLEVEIERFKTENFELLPDTLATRVEELFDRENDLRAVRRDVATITAEIAELQPDAQRTTTQRRLSQLRDALDAARADEQRLAEIVADLEPMLRTIPQIERELAGMERREAQLRDRLRLTSERRSESELAARLEADQQSERFELIETAVIPDYPISRSKRIIATMGMFGAIMTGLAVVFTLEVLRPVLRTSSQVERAMGMRPVLTIPDLHLPSERRRRGLAWLAGLGLAALSALAVLLQLRSS